MRKCILLSVVLFILQHTSGQTNYSLSFDGSSYTDCGTGSGFNITGTTITVKAWIYPTSFSTNYWEGSIVAKDQPLAKGFVLRCGATGQLSFVLGVTGGVWTEVVSVNNALTLNMWQHVAAVYDGTSMLLYVNGTQMQSASENRTIVEDPAMPLRIGGSPGGWSRFFTGKIDEVRVWNVARTNVQIREKMFKGISTGTGLVASYNMNDGTGTSLTDNTGNGNTGTLSASVTWQSSPVRFGANALAFYGTDDYVTVPRQPAHDISTEITMEGWVYATKNTGIQNVMAKSQAGNASGYIFPRTDDGWNNAKFYMYISGAWRSFNAPYPSRDAWHHLAATYNGTTVKIYVDGVLTTTQAQAGTITTSSLANLTLGNQSGVSEYFGGYADELRIWNVVRSEADIQANMNRELDPTLQTGLVAYFTNNQGVGSGTNTGLTVLQDLAGTQNGTLTNFSLTGSTSNYVGQNGSMRVLPVQWKSFNVRKIGTDILLNWATDQELNVRNFVVHHSTDGIRWEKIGNVNANSARQYSFTHYKPESGIHYYRLQQIDQDGDGNFSNTCIIDMSIRNSNALLYPNPSKSGEVNVYLPAAGMIRIYDQAGRNVRIVPAKEGWQKISTSGMTTGVYFLKFGKDGTVETLVIE